MNFLFIGLLVSSVFAAYIGSWFPPIAGFPFGGIIRDAIILLLIMFTFLIISRSRHMRLYEFFLILSWFLFIFWIGALILLDENKTVALLGARNFILFPLVGLIAYICVNKLDILLIRRAIYLIAFIAASLGILDIFSQGEILNILGYRPDYSGSEYTLVKSYLGYNRASGGLADALNYGYTMSVFAIYAAFLMLKERREVRYYSIFKSFISVSLVVLTSLATIFSLTRGAILVLFIGLFFLLFRFSSKKVFSLTSILIIIVLLIFTQSPYKELLRGRLLQTDEISVLSTKYRVQMAYDSIKTLTDSPWGIGLGTQGAGVKTLANDTRINSDNYFFMLALESGIPGLLIFTLVIMLNFLLGFKYSRYNVLHSSMLIVFLLILFISGMLSSAPNSPIFSIIYWTILNVEVGSLKKNSRLDNESINVYVKRKYKLIL